MCEYRLIPSFSDQHPQRQHQHPKGMSRSIIDYLDCEQAVVKILNKVDKADLIVLNCLIEPDLHMHNLGLSTLLL